MSPVKKMTAAEFDQLVRKHYQAVYLVAYSRLGNRDHAEDVAQETFLRAYLAIDQLKDRSRFPHWVCRIARNLAIDWLRSPGQDRRLIAGADLEAEVAEIADKRALNPRETAARAEARRRTEEALAQLEPEIREVLLLHTVEELNFREIGERLGIHATTAKYRMGKATAQCRQLLRHVPDIAATVASSKSAAAKCSSAIAVVGAMSAGTREALAAKAASSTAAATASLTTGTSKAAILLSQPLISAAFLGGVIMGSKQIAVVVAGAALLAGGGVYYVTEQGLPLPSQNEIIEGPVSIKPSAPGTQRAFGHRVKDSSVFTSATLGEVLAFANHFGPVQTVVAANVPKDRYDISVKHEGVFYEKLSNVICEKFDLQVRREMQERDVLVLTAPNGRPSALRPPTGSSETLFEDEGIKSRNIHIRQFYGLVEELLEKPVINETGISLTEYFDYGFSWKGVGKNEELMIRAVRDQLGFTLTPAKRPVEILVIEKKKA